MKFHGLPNSNNVRFAKQYKPSRIKSLLTWAWQVWAPPLLQGPGPSLLGGAAGGVADPAGWDEPTAAPGGREPHQPAGRETVHPTDPHEPAAAAAGPKHPALRKPDHLWKHNRESPMTCWENTKGLFTKAHHDYFSRPTHSSSPEEGWPDILRILNQLNKTNI